jgi:hypothetical protein
MRKSTKLGVPFFLASSWPLALAGHDHEFGI